MKRRSFLLALACAPALSTARAADDDRRTTIGVEARYLYRSEIPVRARQVTSGKEPLLLRIASETVDGGATIYDLRAVAFEPGVHDLRTVLERTDGGPADALPPATIEVFTVLPKGHRGIEPVDDTQPPRLGGYRATLLALGALWALPLIFIVLRRVMRRRSRPAVVIAPRKPTLAEQLQPLVEAALAGRASTEERARIERLLLAHWRERLGLNDESASRALAVMREHPEAGVILRAVEEWLHKPRTPGAPTTDIAPMLAPYSAVAGVELGAAQQVELKPIAAHSPRADGGRA